MKSPMSTRLVLRAVGALKAHGKYSNAYGVRLGNDRRTQNGHIRNDTRDALRHGSTASNG